MRFAVVTPAVQESVLSVRPEMRDYWDRRMLRMAESKAVWVSAWSDSEEVLGWVIVNWPVDERGASVEDLYVRETGGVRASGLRCSLRWSEWLWSAA